MSMLAPTPLARKTSLKSLEKPEKRTTRNFFGRTVKSAKAPPALRTLSAPIDVKGNDHAEDSEGTSTLSTSLSTTSQISSTLSETEQLSQHGDVVVNTRTSSIGAVNSISLLSNQLQEMEIRRRTMLASQVEHSPVRRPSAPRQIADWDILIEEELIENPDKAPRNRRASLDSFFIKSRAHLNMSIDVSNSYAGTSFLDLKSPIQTTFRPKLDSIKDVEEGPFKANLSKMENSGLKNICRKLSEKNSDSFERRIWAIIASQWLTFGKQLQSPGHDLLSNARITDGRKVLHLHGPAADGWVLAAKYANSTVYSVSSQNITNPNNFISPTNHHMLFVPAVSSPIPFPDNYFDVVVTRTLSSVLKADELDSVLRESYRILRPGGWIELHTIDPTLTRAGDITKRWIESRILVPMEDNFFSVQPSNKILTLMTESGYKSVKNARIALPAALPSLDSDGGSVMVHLGRHFYEELYGQFLRAGHIGEGIPQWWWNSEAVMQECDRGNTCFGLTISFGRK